MPKGPRGEKRPADVIGAADGDPDRDGRRNRGLGPEVRPGAKRQSGSKGWARRAARARWAK